MMPATRLRGRLPKERSRWAGLQPVPGHRGRCGAVPPLRFYQRRVFRSNRLSIVKVPCVVFAASTSIPPHG